MIKEERGCWLDVAEKRVGANCGSENKGGGRKVSGGGSCSRDNCGGERD